MTIEFDRTLDSALTGIGFDNEHLEWLLHQEERPMLDMPKDYRVPLFQRALELLSENMPAHLNDRFGDKLKIPFLTSRNGSSTKVDRSLYKILFEAYTNIAWYGQYTFPSNFHLWIGDGGFVIEIGRASCRERV